jgi:hypothetical protein
MATVLLEAFGPNLQSHPAGRMCAFSRRSISRLHCRVGQLLFRGLHLDRMVAFFDLLQRISSSFCFFIVFFFR